MDLVDEFQHQTKQEMNIKTMSNALKNRGFIVRWNIVENAKRKLLTPIKKELNQKLVP